MTCPEPLSPVPPSVVTLPREIDRANAYAVGELLAARLSPGEVVIADMATTTFCDSAGVRALVLAWQKSGACGCDLRLMMPDPNLLRIFGVLGLDKALPIYHSLDEAVAAHDPG